MVFGNTKGALLWVAQHGVIGYKNNEIHMIVYLVQFLMLSSRMTIPGFKRNDSSRSHKSNSVRGIVSCSNCVCHIHYMHTYNTK